MDRAGAGLRMTARASQLEARALAQLGGRDGHGYLSATPDPLIQIRKSVFAS
jgi:hypothetical protein